MLARIYASMGRYGEAADALTEITGDPNSAVAQAATLLRTAPVKTASPDGLPACPAPNYETLLRARGAISTPCSLWCISQLTEKGEAGQK